MPQEPPWLLLLVYLAAGFVSLAKGADWLVGGSSRLARRLGVSALAIGLTVVAWGTSAPEIVVSVLAAVQGQAAISVGNVLGSNIANIGLVLGLSAIVLPRVLEGRLTGRDTFWLFASIAALWWTCSDGALTRAESLAMLALFVVYNVWLWRDSRRDASTVDAQEGDGDAPSRFHPLAVAIAGMVAVAVGAKLVVMGAEGGALRLGIDERIVGLTVVAVGTSLPELAAGLGSAFKGQSDISLGNVLGSNVFNLIVVLALVGVVRPLVPENFNDPAAAEQLRIAFEGALSNDFPWVLAFSVAFAFLPVFGGARFGRWKGAILLGAYAWYTIRLF
jgi:cation:H+ antiporter